MVAAPSPEPRIFTLTRNGEEVRVLVTTKNGRYKAYRFPYTTNDQQEIDYLLRRGATAKRPKPMVVKTKPATAKSGPAYPPYKSFRRYEPLEGGDQK